MRQSGREGFGWGEIAWVGLVGGVFAVGLLATWRSLADTLVKLAMTAAVLLAAWQWHRVVRQADEKNVQPGDEAGGRNGHEAAKERGAGSGDVGGWD